MPDLSEKLTISVSKVWNGTLPHRIESLAVGCVFKSKDIRLLVGQDDGVIRSYKLPSTGDSELKLQDIFETKGGPIQNILLHDVAQFKSTDIVCSDNHGTLTIFCNGQILMRKNVSNHCLNCLVVRDDQLGHIEIVCSDTNGQICFVRPYGSQTHLRLADIALLKEPTPSVYVLSLLAVNLADSSRQVLSYVLVGDNCSRLHFFHQDCLVLTLKTPTNITAMCAGYFLSDSDTIPLQSSDGVSQQVALGTDTGAVYILQDFEIFATQYFNRGSRITSLSTCRHPNPVSEDIIVCAGHFNGISVLHKGKEVTNFQTDDWVSSVSAPHTNRRQVVIGCYNGKIYGLELTFS